MCPFQILLSPATMTAPAVSAIRVGLFSVGAGGAAIAGSGHDPRTSPLYSSLADAVGMPLLRSIDAEDAHNFTIRLLEAGLAPVDPLRGARGVLRTSVWGLGFSSPLGLAAGFDKQGRALAPLLRMGLGYVEVGGITPLPQPGNPRPRMFRLPEDKAVINRFGLNSEGSAPAALPPRHWRRGQACAGNPLGRERPCQGRLMGDCGLSGFQSHRLREPGKGGPRERIPPTPRRASRRGRAPWGGKRRRPRRYLEQLPLGR